MQRKGNSSQQPAALAIIILVDPFYEHFIILAQLSCKSKNPRTPTITRNEKQQAYQEEEEKKEVCSTDEWAKIKPNAIHCDTHTKSP